MTQHDRKNLSLALGSTAVVVLLISGCAGVDDAGSDATEMPGDLGTQSDELRPWYRRGGPRPVPHARSGTGGTTSTGGSTSPGGTSNSRPTSGAAECELCAKANACCNTVGGGPLCTFSAATCASLPASSQAPYINACGVLLDTVASVHSVLPDSCR